MRVAEIKQIYLQEISPETCSHRCLYGYYLRESACPYVFHVRTGSNGKYTYSVTDTSVSELTWHSYGRKSYITTSLKGLQECPQSVAALVTGTYPPCGVSNCGTNSYTPECFCNYFGYRTGDWSESSADSGSMVSFDIYDLRVSVLIWYGSKYNRITTNNPGCRAPYSLRGYWVRDYGYSCYSCSSSDSNNNIFYN